MITRRIYRNTSNAWYTKNNNELLGDNRINEEIDHIYHNIKRGKQEVTKVTENTYITEGGGSTRPKQPEVPENTYNIHISALHQYYIQAPSQLEGSGVASGYWNYLTKDFVDIYEPILTPISFRKINGVKIAASITVGGTPDRIVGVMDLVDNVPTGQPNNWNDCAMKHAINFVKDTIWGTQTPDWYFMYKMEIVRFVNGVETLIDTRRYKIKFNPSEGVINGIRRLYDSNVPPQPIYNPIIMLELIINVTL